MKKKLILILNKEILSSGLVMNAIGHIAVGIAPRFSKGNYPDIDLYVTNKEGIREFRTHSYLLNKQLDNINTVFSDFSPTTINGSAQDHEKQTAAISESDINYYACCFCANEDIIAPIEATIHTNQFKLLKSFSENNAQFEFNAPIDYPDNPDFVEDTKKFSIVLSPGLSFPDEIEALFKTSLLLACRESINTELLRLHQYTDADNTRHPGMSEYGLVVLRAKNKSTLANLKNSVMATQLDSCSIYPTGEPDGTKSVGLFGEIATVKNATKKNIQLWKATTAHLNLTLNLFNAPQKQNIKQEPTPENLHASKSQPF